MTWADSTQAVLRGGYFEVEGNVESPVVYTSKPSDLSTNYTFRDCTLVGNIDLSIGSTDSYMVFYNVDSASDVTISLDSADTGELTLLFAGGTSEDIFDSDSSDDGGGSFQQIVISDMTFSVGSGDETNDHNICLLYTSPSPRDRTRSRMPSSA